MDDHQREMWTRMLARVDDYSASRLALGDLVADLRRLFVEADPHDPRTRGEFELPWAALDGEFERRTEAWAPAGEAADTALHAALEEFATWIRTSVLSDESTSHR